MRTIASLILTALVTVGSTTCAGAASESPMACCPKVRHECPKMEQMKVCCPAPQGTQSESNAARLEPIASLRIQSDAGFLARGAALPIVDTPLHTLRLAWQVSPPTRHSIDCILLI